MYSRFPISLKPALIREARIRFPGPEPLNAALELGISRVDVCDQARLENPVQRLAESRTRHPSEEIAKRLAIPLRGQLQLFNQPSRSPRHVRTVNRGLQYLVQVMKGRFLADGDPAAYEPFLQSDVLEIGQQVRLADTEIPRNQHSFAVHHDLDSCSDFCQRRSESDLDFLLVAAELPDRVAVGDAIAQGFDGAPLGDCSLFIRRHFEDSR